MKPEILHNFVKILAETIMKLKYIHNYLELKNNQR